MINFWSHADLFFLLSVRPWVNSFTSPCLGGPPGSCRNDDRNYGFGFWWGLNEIVLVKGLAWCLSPFSVNHSYRGFSIELPLSIYLMSRDEEGGIPVVKELSENAVRICRKEGLQGWVGICQSEKDGGKEVFGRRNSTCKEIEPWKVISCLRKGEDFGMAGAEGLGESVQHAYIRVRWGRWRW